MEVVPPKEIAPQTGFHTFLPIYPRFFSHIYASRSLYDLTNCVGGPQLANVFFILQDIPDGRKHAKKLTIVPIGAFAIRNHGL